MLRKAAVPKRICDRRRAQNALWNPVAITLQYLSLKNKYLPLLALEKNVIYRKTFHSNGAFFVCKNPEKIKHVMIYVKIRAGM